MEPPVELAERCAIAATRTAHHHREVVHCRTVRERHRRQDWPRREALTYSWRHTSRHAAPGKQPFMPTFTTVSGAGIPLACWLWSVQSLHVRPTVPGAARLAPPIMRLSCANTWPAG